MKKHLKKDVLKSSLYFVLQQIHRPTPNRPFPNWCNRPPVGVQELLICANFNILMYR